ncbi:hypothetical protein [Comamonas sediminis]
MATIGYGSTVCKDGNRVTLAAETIESVTELGALQASPAGRAALAGRIT